ncbi:MAG: DUF5684 domain-containing protein [Phycisphaerae bacterium]|nr:DUF5684 domain-containing protein [Phycisphaerae bacterium]
MEDVLHVVLGLFYLALVILLIASSWKLFEKANQPGWGCLVPIYNMVLYARIAGKSGWWAILTLIPYVNIVIGILLAIGIAKNFGRGIGTILGLIFLPFIFLPILAFGKAEYNPVNL